MSPLTHIRSVPVDIFRIVSEWLSCDDLACTPRSIACSKVQTLIRLSRREVYDHCSLNTPQHWHVVFYLSSIGHIESIVLDKHANVSTRGLLALASLRPHSLPLNTYAISGYDHPNAPFSYSSIRNQETPDPALKSLQTLTVEDMSLSRYFPDLRSLVLNSPVASILSSPIYTQSYPIQAELDGLKQFFKTLPSGLQTLRCTNPSLIVTVNTSSLLENVPLTLTDAHLRKERPFILPRAHRRCSAPTHNTPSPLHIQGIYGTLEGTYRLCLKA